MKLLLDQGLPHTAARRLRDAAFDAVHTSECGLSSATDSAIIDYAREHKQVVVTLDSDFHALLALSGATGPSVVRIRIEGLRAEAASDLIRMIVNRCRDDLDTGALVSVTEEQIRVRKLPIGTHPKS